LYSGAIGFGSLEDFVVEFADGADELDICDMINVESNLG